MPEQVYRRLLMLQNKMNSFLKHRAGLNPKGNRAYFATGVDLSQRGNALMDGALLMQYVGLDRSLQEQLAKGIGATVDVVLDDLLSTQLAKQHF